MAAQGYIGRAPGESSVVVARQTFTPTGITTNFTFASGYTVGYVDAYLNGARLIEGDDYTATDGSVVGLTTHAINGDVLEIVVYKAFNLANVTGANGDFSVPDKIVHTDDLDTAIRFPQVDTFTVETAGSEVLRVDANGNVGIGTTNTLAVADPKNQSVLNVGVVTANSVTAAAGTFGSLNVSGTLTYDDVTNVDAVGYSTFREGINVQGAGSTTTTLNVTGVTTMTGDVNIAAAFNIPDAITHVGDTNTKIRFPAADTFSVDTAGAERLRVDSSGNVGIGTNSPQHLCQIAGTLAVDSYNDTSKTITLRPGIEANANGGMGLQAKDHSGAFPDGLGIYGTDGVSIMTANAGTFFERCRWDTAGRFLVGTSSSAEDSRAVFQANSGSTTSFGTIKLARGNAPSDGFRIGSLQFTDNNHESAAAVEAVRDGGTWTSGSSHPTRLLFSTTADGASSPTERLRIASDGNVSIGGTEGITYSLLDGLVINTDNGDAGLVVNSSSSAHNAYISFAYGNSGAVSHADQFSAYIGRLGDDTLVLGTANQQRLRIDSSGEVIVGGSQNGEIYLGNGTNQRGIFTFDGTGSEFLDIGIKGTQSQYGHIRFNTGTTPTERLRIDSSGRVAGTYG